jgi:hypothetical protein
LTSEVSRLKSISFETSTFVETLMVGMPHISLVKLSKHTIQRWHLEKRTWRKGSKIIALTTKLTKMQAKFEQQVPSFATQAASNKDNNNASAPKS